MQTELVTQAPENAAYPENMVAMNEALLLSSLAQHELRLNAESANAQLVVEIGERKQMEAALVASQAALAEANRRLDDRAALLEDLVRLRTTQLSETVAELESFSYSIAHDLRAPLRAMSSFAELILIDNPDQLNADGQLCLKRIVRSAEVMDHLIRDVLSYGQILRAKPTLEVIDLNRLVRETIEYFPALAHQGAEVRIDGPFPPVLGNAALLMQVFSHLLDNAIKFTQSGEPPHIRIRSESGSRLVRFFVSDSGIGISSDQHQKIFGIFEQLDQAKGGTGIGLAIFKKAIARMGGTVGVVSEPGRGATFWFDLPLA